MALSALKRWRLQCPNGPLNLVFPTPKGTVYLHTHLLRCVFYPVMERAGLAVRKEKGAATPASREFNFHVLRHIAASLFIEQDWGPKKVMSVMGHSSIQITYDVYGHLFPTPKMTSKPSPTSRRGCWSHDAGRSAKAGCQS